MVEIIVSLITLIVLELILGIDNIIFISIITDKVEAHKRDRLRKLGLGLAVVIRLIMLSFLTWIMKLDNTLFTFIDINFTGKGLILIAGGAFLIWKTVKEFMALQFLEW